MPQLPTIAAIATAPGAGAVGVVRVSGPEALMIADRLYCNSRRQRPRVPLSQRESHRIYHGWLQTPDGRYLDEVVVLVMRAPRSFTGEDVVEFQTHGGGTVPYAVLEACLEAGARLAAAGEFTKRAFLNGRLDLAQAEAVHDLVSAKSERALAHALAQLDGALSRQVAGLRDEVIGLLARLEAAIDYPDEIDDLPQPEAIADLTRLIAQVDTILATAKQGQLFREGARLAIVGRPNVGKSSLLNALLGHQRAIVTAIPGTTRDILEEGLTLSGVPFRVVDTAGIRETDDVVEAIGVARSRALLESADVVMLVVDLTQGVTEVEQELTALAADRPLVVVGNKRDQVSEDQFLPLLEWAGGSKVAIVAAATGEGLPDLERVLVECALGMPISAISQTTVNARHRACLEAARLALAHALDSAKQGLPGDFWAIDLTGAAAAMSEITGDALAEEVIEQVFSRFCVGK